MFLSITGSIINALLIANIFMSEEIHFYLPQDYLF